MKPFLLFGLVLALTIGLVLFLAAQYPGALRDDDNQIDLIWRLAVLVPLLASVLVGLRARELGPALRAALVWIGLGLALVVGYSFRDELAPLARRVGGNLLPAEPITLEPGVVSLRADRSGHFSAVAEVNHAGGAAQRVPFLVDTGASDVALTREDARRLGLEVERLTYNIPYRTANGTAMGARVRLARVRLGDIALDDVLAHVASGDMGGQSLLGMSFLRRLSGFEIRGQEMILRR